ncbi:CBS domain-containing protein [Tessaracoccus sp. MC1679]|uniref:CBS domain-containing protein n=1 Tax=Tessaracoccus sp. MC1679 TaxID=2760313 RepID=UPI001603631C|nr:CBS domain-containing protein [Tessaracoccus sp. MC1679]MBB1514568.1 CBS domain-containing protein [Tessaracoccus sp. MC1679]
MKTARDIMTTPAETLAPTATLTEAAQQLRDLNVGSLPILDGDHLLGVVTDRDIVVRGIAEGLDPSNATVAEVATGAVVTVDVDDDAEKVARIMGERQVRRVPVLDGGKLVGVIAQADVARDLDARTTGDVVEDISQS